MIYSKQRLKILLLIVLFSSALILLILTIINYFGLGKVDAAIACCGSTCVAFCSNPGAPCPTITSCGPPIQYYCQGTNACGTCGACTPPPAPPPNGCTGGSCYTGIGSCTQIGGSNGSGTCSGGICCNPPSGGGGGGGGCPGLCWYWGNRPYDIDGNIVTGGDPNATCPGSSGTFSKGWASPIGPNAGPPPPHNPRNNPWVFACRTCNPDGPGGNYDNPDGTGNFVETGQYPCGMGMRAFFGRAYCLGSGGQIYPIPGATVRYYNATRNYTDVPPISARWQENPGGATSNATGNFEFIGMGGTVENIDITLPAGNLPATGKPYSQLVKTEGFCSNGAVTGCGSASCGAGNSYNCTSNKAANVALPTNQTQLNNVNIPKTYNIDFVYTNCEICNATNPTVPILSSPANGATLPTPNSAALSWDNTAFGLGCPSNNNHYNVYLSANCTGTYTLANQITANSTTVGGLTANTTYCWYVNKSNGTNSVNSAVRSFKTNAWPQIFYGGQVLTDVCGTGTSGRAGPSNVTNPVKFAFGMVDADSDIPNAIHFTMVPRSISGGAAVYPNPNVSPNIDTWSTFYIAMSYGGGTSWISQYTPSGGWTASGSGDFSVGNGRATVLGINDGTNRTVGVTAGQNTNANFQIRLENSFGTGNFANPTGIWDLYVIGVTQNSDSNYYPTNGTWGWLRMGEWKVDLTVPSAFVNGPAYNSDGSFTMTYNYSDNLPMQAAGAYITTTESSPSLRDNTIAQNIVFGSPPSTFTSPPNAFYTFYGSGAQSYSFTRNYTDQSAASAVQYSYLLHAVDQGCNIGASSASVTEPSPWLLTGTGNASVNGSTMFDSVTANMIIPDTTITNIALGKTATYSAAYSEPTYSASKAIDGDVNGNAASGTLAIVNYGANAWWQVDLGSVQQITTVNIYGRTDCCAVQSSDYYLFVSDVPFTSGSLSTTLSQPGVSNYYTSGAPGLSTKNVNRSGRYIRVQLSGTNFLSLAEVQVYASQPFNITGLTGYAYDGGVNGPFFSSYSSMSGTAQTIAKPNSNISRLNRYVTTYTNEAAIPQTIAGNSWYDYLLPIVQGNSTEPMLDFSTTNEVTVSNPQFPVGQSYTGQNLSTLFGIAPNTKRNINFTGNVWFLSGMICDIQSVIFISGNLRIAPNFTKTAGNGCIFVVNGNISLGTGQAGATVPLTSPAQPYYDIIAATLIADDYIWADNNIVGGSNKNEGLYVRGGVITTGNFEWNRDLNTSANAFHPAIIISNDPIYYSLFRGDFRTKDYSIREQQ